MEIRRRQNSDLREPSRSLWLVVIIAACLLVTLVAVFLPRRRAEPESRTAATAPRSPNAGRDSASNRERSFQHRPEAVAAGQLSAEEIVARRAAQFARSRREVLHGIARKLNLAVPDDVERFFDAAEAGHWDEIESAFNALQARRTAQPHSPELDQLWGPILTTFGTLEQAHEWPAQKYLDYGNAILDSLRPDMVYVGGTDPGRFIPELMAETGDAESHVVITQNGLADGVYLDYLRFIYADRLSMPSTEEVQHAFQDYLTDYQKRLAHDQQFPDEPKQIRPGERVGSPDGSGGWTVTLKEGGQLVQVSGQVAAMAINERILQLIMQKNPEASFGLEESFPLKSTYAGASSLGPIMELRAADGPNALSADVAARSLAWWQSTSQQLLADPEATGSSLTMRTYSKMVKAQGSLFAAHGLNDQAEQAYRLAIQLCPYNPEGVFGYVSLLTGQNRTQDALAVAQAAAQADPKNSSFQNLAVQLQKSLGQAAGK